MPPAQKVLKFSALHVGVKPGAAGQAHGLATAYTECIEGRDDQSVWPVVLINQDASNISDYIIDDMHEYRNMHEYEMQSRLDIRNPDFSHSFKLTTLRIQINVVLKLTLR